MKQEKIVLSKFNIGLIAMLIFLVYISYTIFVYANKEKIFAYQVKEGSLAESNVYTGIILREEKIFQSNNTGFIDYFAREGEHLGVGDLIYTIDESGAMDQLMSSTDMGENLLTDEELSDLRSEVINFSSTFEAEKFSETYDFLYTMDGMVLKLANMNILEQLNRADSAAINGLVKFYNASETGYVVYHTDGYESLSINGITPEIYDETAYEKTQLINNTLIEQGADVYKMITSEEWQIVIPVEEERANELSEEGYVQIKFLDNQRIVWVEVDIHQNLENFYAVLTLNNSVVSFCTDRFIDIELISNAETGLKIPVSSIVHKEFFLIPKEYAIEQGEDNTFYFLRKTFLEDGTVSAELLPVDVYAETEEYYYVDDTFLQTGDYLIKQDALSEYPVSTRGELVGVYNMNKGYADFRQIIILYQNEEYAIVKSNTAYGLNVYDYIVLDASAVAEDDILYE